MSVMSVLCNDLYNVCNECVDGVEMVPRNKRFCAFAHFHALYVLFVWLPLNT